MCCCGTIFVQSLLSLLINWPMARQDFWGREYAEEKEVGVRELPEDTEGARHVGG